MGNLTVIKKNFESYRLKLFLYLSLPLVERNGGVNPSGVVQPFMGWVSNEWVDINWDASPVSSPVTALSHRGEFNKYIMAF